MKLGQINQLTVLRNKVHGAYLGVDEQEDGGILLPANEFEVPPPPGSVLNVFVYHDSEGRLICSLREPLITLHQFAFLSVKSVTPFGAFIDIGMPKDLFVPFSEQMTPMVEGNSYVCYMYIDEIKSKLIGSTKIEDIIDNEECSLQVNDEVDLLIYQKSDLGFKAIINQEHLGLIFHSDVHKPLALGDRLKGYIKTIRPDQKIDLVLNVQGVEHIGVSAEEILTKLDEHSGFLPYHDKSAPEEIKQFFGMSKKAFKRGIGSLYKARKITIQSDGIRKI